ncbi:MAG: PocR ligand-binding domain-containing protein [Spirochaetes bacterium]|nr:PocR ligand-binding domain-containing protein [Spirochaetota bacterium]
MELSHAMKSAIDIILRNDVQEVLDYFAACFNIKITFFSFDGKELTTGMNRSGAEYCRLIQTKLDRLSFCTRMDREKCAESARTKSMAVYQCHAGLMEAVMPVIVDGQIAGFIMIGQFRTSDSIQPHLLKQYKRKFGAVKELRAAFYRLPYVPEKNLSNILGLFSVIVRYIVSSNMVSLKGNLLVEKTLEYLKANIEKTISLSDIETLTGKSASTISHLFKSTTGKSFKETLLDMKLSKADAYFRTAPSPNVREIAKRLGFEDPFYFSRIYKKYRKMSPRDAIRDSRSVAR